MTERRRCQATRPGGTPRLWWWSVGRQLRGARARAWTARLRSTSREHRRRPWRPSQRPLCGRCRHRCRVARRGRIPSHCRPSWNAGHRSPFRGLFTRSTSDDWGGVECPGDSGVGLVNAWASAGSTATMMGTVNTPVPAIAAVRSESRRPVAPTAPPGCVSPLQFPIGRAMYRQAVVASTRETSRSAGFPGRRPFNRPDVARRVPEVDPMQIPLAPVIV